MSEKDTWWDGKVAELRAELGREPTKEEIDARRDKLWRESIRALHIPPAVSVKL